MQQRKSASIAKGNEAAVPEVPASLPNSRAGFWLDAHYDPVANLKAFSTCLHTCDLYGDGDWRLAVAGLDKKLKASVYARLASAKHLQALGSAEAHSVQSAGLEGHTNGI
jgi:hypothetical protein